MSESIRQLETVLTRELGRVVIGAEAAIRAVTIALIARGHVLVQGVPGLGKTLLAKSLARVLGGEFKRIQGTPDLMPGDIIGTHIFDESQHTFVFRRGPIFADVVLVDEINRAGPKTQSALLEAMEERQVSVDREVFALPADFLVLATQNPREFEGTYPLPESQLDRFMLRIDIAYPAREAEARILDQYGARMGAPAETEWSAPVGVTAAQTIAVSNAQAVRPSLDRALLISARAEAEKVHVSEALTGYVLDLARASRENPRVSLGLSTRGALALIKAARIAAGLRGSEFVAPDDVKEVAVWIMSHRILLTPEAALDGATNVDVVNVLLGEVPVPR
jgi:MoxR-like ATPase